MLECRFIKTTHHEMSGAWCAVGGVVLTVQELLLLAEHSGDAGMVELPLLPGKVAR